MTKNTLYGRIEEDIRAKIVDGTYPPGSRLMPESEMIEHYRVSRITVRNAMANLANDGFVVRVRGKGSFVREDVRTTGAVHGSIGVRTKLIGVIVPILDDQHTQAMFQSIYAAASGLGYSLSIHQTYHDQTREEECIRICLAMGVDGVVIYPVQNDTYNEAIIKLVLDRFPVVLIDRTLKGLNVSSVVTDNEKAAFDATRYLLDLGHREIGLLSSPVEFTIPLSNRYNGYLRAYEASGLKVDQGLISFQEVDTSRRWIVLDPTMMEPRVEMAIEYLRSCPRMTGLVCAEPIEGVATMLATMRLGIRVPEDLSIVYFDDFKMAELMYVPPTVVRQNGEEIGREAIRLLHEIIVSPGTECRHLKINAELIVRGSTTQSR